jgi:guanylate kinase
MNKLEMYIIELFQRMLSNFIQNLQKVLIEIINRRQHAAKPLVILGPCGVGKETMIKKLKLKYPKLFVKLPSYTTRSRKDGEKNAKDFYFITKEEFDKKKNEGKLFGIQEYNDNYYATNKDILEEFVALNDKIIILNYHIETANYINKEGNFTYIALLPPCEAELQRRLVKKKIKPEEIDKRMKSSINEIMLINEANYINFRIVNDNEIECFRKLESYIKDLYPNFFVNID